MYRFSVFFTLGRFYLSLGRCYLSSGWCYLSLDRCFLSSGWCYLSSWLLWQTFSTDCMIGIPSSTPYILSPALQVCPGSTSRASTECGAYIYVPPNDWKPTRPIHIYVLSWGGMFSYMCQYQSVCNVESPAYSGHWVIWFAPAHVCMCLCVCLFNVYVCYMFVCVL